MYIDASCMGGYGKQCTPRRLWLNHVAMFARKIRVEYELDGQRRACSLKWLGNFSMRNFSNGNGFDDSLPVAGGLIEICQKISLDPFEATMGELVSPNMYLSKTPK